MYRLAADMGGQRPTRDLTTFFDCLEGIIRACPVEGCKKRLLLSARAIRLEIPYTKDQVREAMEQTFTANGFTDCYIRLVVTRGVGTLGIDPKRCGRPSLFIISNGPRAQRSPTRAPMSTSSIEPTPSLTS